MDLHFLTFKSFNDVGKRTYCKLKNAKFELELSTDEL